MSYTQKAGMMLNYSLVSTAICCSIALLYGVLYRKGRKIRIEDIILSILLILISSLRYDVGSDYFRYLESAERWVRRFPSIKMLFSGEMLEKYSFEIGYKILSVFANRISDSQYAIFWVVSVLLYIPIVWYCRKKTSNSSIAIAVFLLFGFWGLTLNIMQQALAMMFVLYSYEALKNKKYLMFIILAICAEMFHTSAIVAIIVVIVINFGVLKKFWEPTKHNLLLMIAIGVILRFGTGFIIRFASRINMFAKYMEYLNAGVTDNISRKYIMYGAFIETVIVIMILYFSIRNVDLLKKYNINVENIISFIMIGIPFSIIGISRTLWLSNRFAKFFFFFLIILIPDLVGNSEQKREKRGHFVLKYNQFVFWCLMIAWHAIYAVLMLDNNRFHIGTYLFK